MGNVQPYPICGFVPPYILSAIADSAIAKPDPVGEISRAACKHTLQHGTSYATQRHELCARTQVSPPDAGRGFTPKYVLGAIAESKQSSKLWWQKRLHCQASCKERSTITMEPTISLERLRDQKESTPDGYNNAFWDGEAQRMVFGDGDHITFDFLTDSLDVIAHELSHGFVQFSSPLEYASQSGALNESCADIFGSMVEQWHMHQSVDDADWILGQTLFPVAFTGSALRTFKAGKAYKDDPIFKTDPQPKHMDDLYKGPNDRGGVHINSEIPNHAFYLATKSLGGSSWERAGKVWYKTMISGKIEPNCDFKTFARATVDIAGEEFVDKSVQMAIRDAWVKVGVLAQTKI
ncbi:Peptidase M4 [Pyrenophora tritici-repentis]|uniref:Peptidase M4 n=1 Tax=Pyrenophora tritici-repentis TaxID=45151 RepID=A0A317A420_9PLEO|nr:Peptidase M4 [Pyrenophora tritici-repentis]KAI1682249.1 Peptidase M4 [Pyrenophora tritici-repentis]